MRTMLSILGLLLPSALCVPFTLSCRVLRTNTSDEFASYGIAVGLLSVLLVFALSCVPNLVRTAIAARRKDRLWKLSALGIALCAVLTTLTVQLVWLIK